MKDYKSISTLKSGRFHESIESNEMQALVGLPHRKAKKGLNIWSASVFITGEMAGSGVLALPRAIVNAGWIGLVLLAVFCFNSAFGGIKLGACWEILEERFPEYRTKTRNPYAQIAYKAVGNRGRIIVSNCIRITLFGAGTVYLLLSSEIIQELFQGYTYSTSSCVYFFVIAAILTPAMWLGSPKDFSLVGIIATLTTAIACVLFFVQMVHDAPERMPLAKHEVHGFQEFFLAFGTLLFAFGGASTFPTIQNDMENKKTFKYSVFIAFSVIILLYFPVSAAGYLIYGDNVQQNIALSLSKSTLVTIANTLMAIHLVFAFLIVINPVCQEIEEGFKIPNSFNYKRCVIRTGIVIIMIIAGESIPDFSKILALIGGSAVTLLTFVFPPYFYMRLCAQEDENWQRKRHISLPEKVYMWELISIGIIGGTAATYHAIAAIFAGSMTKPCFLPH